jgi:hypothetical protein
MRILRFIGLKVAEIGGVVLYVWGSHWIVLWFHPRFTDGQGSITEVVLEYVLCALITPLTVTMVGLLCFLLFQWVKKNWEWSK